MSRNLILGRLSQNRARALKFILTETILFLTVILLQTTLFARIRLFGAVPDICFVTLILISYFCGKEVGAITGIVAGFAVDALGSVGISLLPIFYMFCGYLFGHFTRAIYPKRYVSYLVVLAAAIPVRMVITFVCICINYNTLHLLEILGRVLLPEATATAILAAGLYFPVRKICMFMNR